jgi:hypothetical protein|tara:strand:+ start:47 stop:268 length:222 start_codon:yes stop_codon:yes gene_type:complete
MTIERVDQPDMLAQFRQRLVSISQEQQQLAAKMEENKTTALKLQGAIETLEYYNPELKEEPTASHPPDEETEE